jgi:hypothetical protein
MYVDKGGEGTSVLISVVRPDIYTEDGPVFKNFREALEGIVQLFIKSVNKAKEQDDVPPIPPPVPPPVLPSVPLPPTTFALPLPLYGYVWVYYVDNIQTHR